MGGSKAVWDVGVRGVGALLIGCSNARTLGAMPGAESVLLAGA